MCWCQEYKSAHRTRLRVPTTTSHLGGHPPIEGRDERERCARKRSEAERVGCAITGPSRDCCARLDAVETLCDTPIIGAAQMPSRRPDLSSTPAQSSNSRSLITRSRSRARVRARALGMRGDGSNVCCYVGGVRDRCSHDAAGHDVLELTVHGLGEAPYPTATPVADVIQKANQPVVLWRPLRRRHGDHRSRSRSRAGLGLFVRWIGATRIFPPNSTVSPYRTGSRTASTTSYLRGGAPRFEGDKSHFHTGAQVATAACIAAEYRFKSQAAFHKRTSRGHPHSRKRNRAGRD